MTRGIWGDPERYLDSYWRRFPGVWVHGDWASRDADGSWFLHGRSDDTLSVAGKRLGPAEVESALAAHPAVQESAAVGVPHPIKGEVLWCVVVLRPGVAGSASLATELRQTVRIHLGKLVHAGTGPVRHVAPQDPQREDRAAGGAGRRDRRRRR